MGKVYGLNAQEAAERADVHPETLKRMARDGRIDARKNISGWWFFNVDDIDRTDFHGVRAREHATVS